MFSQSLCVDGNESLLRVLGEQPSAPKQQQHRPESMEVIDESPTSLQNQTRTSLRNISRRAQKQPKDSRPKKDSTEKSHASISTENYSEFFVDNCNIVFPPQICIDPQTINRSLEKYFADHNECHFAAKSTPTIPPPLAESNFDGIFDKTNIFSQMASNNDESSENIFDKAAISLSDLNDTMESLKILDSEASDKEAINEQQQSAFVLDGMFDGSEIIPKTRADASPSSNDLAALAWDDSSEFMMGIPADGNDGDDKLVNCAAEESVRLMVDENVALGIDDVTFTQAFLSEQNMDGSNGNVSKHKSSGVNEFIRNEMEMCKNAVTNDSDSNVSTNFKKKSEPGVELQMESATLQRSTKFPTKNQNKIENWGLSTEIVDEYTKRGIRTMFDWQVECLSNAKVLLEGANLVYSAPTSAGKTLVSELLMIKTILEHRKKSIFILPFVSVVREKMFYFQELLSPAGIRVEGYFGGYTAAGTFDTTQLAVCTIEKANSLINKLLEQQKIEQIGCIVVDEIHMISDEGRGYILELLLSKILYVRQRYGHRIQIVSMSATLPNLDLLTKWLSAEFYFTDFRPVHLCEMIKIDQTLYDNRMQAIRKLDATFADGSLINDTDNVAQLCMETLLEGCSVIVFCPSKDWCEKLAIQLAGHVYALGKSKTKLGEMVRNQIDLSAVDTMKEQLRSCPIGLDGTLSKCVSYACAFHHAGLTTDEREIIEVGFKSGAIRMLTATSTLSSGVNLPARRVIIRTPMFGGAIMNALTYRQMIGRAGRMGRDTLGESILICGSANVRSGKELVSATVKPLGSCLAAQKYVHLKRAILEIIAAGLATAKSDVEQFVNCTLLATDRGCVFVYGEDDLIAATIGKKRLQPIRNDNDEDDADDDGDTTTDPIAHCITFLIRYEFIRIQRNDETNEVLYVATRLGLACLAASMPPADGFLLFSELQKSRQNFVLESELHAVYLVTPFSVCYQMVDLDWLGYLDMWERLPAAMQRVGEMVGVRESFLVRAMRGHKLEYKALQIHKRFYTALALLELVQERPMQEVAVKFKCPRGLLQSMQQMASTFAGIVTAFCQALNWQMLALIVDQFKERLFFGIHRDLIDLMRLSSLTAQRARALFAAGLPSLPDLANADVFKVEKILFDSIGFESNQRRDGENAFDAERRKRSRHLFITGKVGLTIHEAAKLLIEEARRFLEQDLGFQNVQWNNLNASSTNEPINTSTKLQQIETSPLQQKQQANEAIPESVQMFEIRKRKSDEMILPTSNIPNNNLSATSRRKSRRIQNLKQTSPEQIKTHSIRKSDRLIRSNSNAMDSEKENKIENPIKLKIIDTSECDSIGSLNTSSKTTSDSMNASHILSITKNTLLTPSANLSRVQIVNVSGNEELFEKFAIELRLARRIGFSVAVGKKGYKTAPSNIGGNLLINQLADNGEDKTDTVNCAFDNDLWYLAGIAMCLDDITGEVIFYMNLQDNHVQLKRRIQLLDELLGRSNVTLKMYEAREQSKIILQALPHLHRIGCQLEDPRIANWLLQPDDADASLLDMATKYAPECVSLVKLIGETGTTASSVALDVTSLAEPRLRAVIECCASVHILSAQRENLDRIGENLLKTFIDMEMPIQKTLAEMEVYGMPVNVDEISKLCQSLDETVQSVERKIFQLNGRRFNIGSAKEVSKVLGMRSQKTPATAKISTAKNVLLKLSDPLSQLIVQHRKLVATLNKTMRPLKRSILKNRLHCNSFSLTSTGRISMQEPNLQNIAKDFSVDIGATARSISCRSVFVAPTGRTLIAADFCQLELRILTHLSQDGQLLRVVQAQTDIFTTIAAKWQRLPESQITVDQRNKAKQICYGIIYGMGRKSLAEALEMDEEDAAQLSDTFHETYPGIRTYTDNVVKYAQQQGYVETLAGRRRYLPHINNTVDATLRAQAERQAINTTIQGSAADVAKYAMLRMERNLAKYAPTLICHGGGSSPIAIHLVLHLHDELIYEIPDQMCRKAAKILKSSMENCAKLSVPLEVKIKCGNSWGQMKPFDEI